MNKLINDPGDVLDPGATSAVPLFAAAGVPSR